MIKSLKVIRDFAISAIENCKTWIQETDYSLLANLHVNIVSKFLSG